ncbi:MULTISPECIES: DsbA family protein [unclassified Cupriavidus]|uniref:DsbA family protein n=1 Tax=unclassified Cupriavidus TaxID=2640874 RepID=UPI0010F519C4|nr:MULTISPECIES: DsbA family protein [unclassified Cupriavidus]MWL87743.1 thioredoxin domain-containing protein [Cupriavidus sp. SW-Y-13]
MTRLTVPVGPADHIQGAADAPIVMVEYGDFECPYCGRMYLVIKNLQQALGPRLAVVFRHFPLVDMHPHAGAAALVSEAAGQAGKFWAMHDRLYENQSALEDEDLLRYARDLGVPDALTQRAFAGDFESKVEADFRGGMHSGVNGTPTLFLNGTRYDGEPDTASLLNAMKRLLR